MKVALYAYWSRLKSKILEMSVPLIVGLITLFIFFLYYPLIKKELRDFMEKERGRK